MGLRSHFCKAMVLGEPLGWNEILRLKKIHSVATEIMHKIIV